MAFMEFIRAEVTESAAGTYTETEIATPSSRTESMAMLIWVVKFGWSEVLLTDATAESMSVQLVKQSQSGIINLSDADLIESVVENANAGQVQGSLSEFLYHRLPLQGSHIRYDPPILYPRSEMFLGVLGTAGSARSANCRVGYTLEKVNPGDFIAALVD